ncbi:uncharacterized protein LOC110855270 [Folsomia candida]|uniref:uncharacterized protein LOC110855270 n=1 Tax=Folsomia candida TaxID=158441 RepID=UPI001604E374|nr:uncharacterized protein LOC110855270 [Folsomia candida]
MRFSLDVQKTSSKEEEESSPVEYIIRKVLEICENENRTKNDEIFILAIGIRGNNCCDLVQLLELLDPNQDRPPDPKKSLIELLKANGAPYCEKYVLNYVHKHEASFLGKVFATKPKEAKLIANELPAQCRHGSASTATNTDGYSTSVFRPSGSDPVENMEEPATRENAKLAIEKALSFFSTPQPRSLQYVAQLIRSFVTPGETPNSNVITKQHLRKLMHAIHPYIYYIPRMCDALQIAIETFDRFSHEEKVLALVTEEWAMDEDPTKFAVPLASRNIQVLTVVFTRDDSPFPRKLYFDPKPYWLYVHRWLFALSSPVDNANPSFSILLERGWELSPRGKSRLFIVAKNPKIMDEFTAILNHMFTRGSAILNILSRVSLDMYINSSKLTPSLQVGRTSYANAVAAAVHLATRRVYRRSGGYPDFDKILNQIVAEYGRGGADTANVLAKYAKIYRLRSEALAGEKQARAAIAQRRPVVATFYLSQKIKSQVDVRHQWDDFIDFFKNNPTGILKSEDIGNHDNSAVGGHAVLLVKCEPDGLVFMNSWGTGWADGGYFRLENEDVLGLKFYDVFFLKSDLKREEIQAYKDKVVDALDTFLAHIPEVTKQLPYVCPLCKVSSPAASFTGELAHVECPKCNKKFEPAPIGLALGWGSSKKIKPDFEDFRSYRSSKFHPDMPRPGNTSTATPTKAGMPPKINKKANKSSLLGEKSDNANY